MNAASSPRFWRIGILGFGEVGRILAEDLRGRGLSVLAFDIRLGGGDDALMRASATDAGVRLAGDHASLAANTDLVISTVTASQTVQAAESCAGGLRSGSWYLDLNSASPGAKARAAAAITAVNGRFVEGAVMASVPPLRIRVPMLLGGADAADLAPALAQLGFSVALADARLGVASATKMFRSVIIKGLEALLIECLTGARAFGVEDAVIASLQETFPELKWEELATYCFQRVILHGHRRAEEMREVAQTVREAGLEPLSARGTAERQEWVASLADRGTFGMRGDAGFARASNWRIEADRILGLGWKM
jgi:3-hydroxyisobutyrate dehydrogenase